MKTVASLLLLIGFGFSTASCGKKDDPTPEPIKQPTVVRPAPAPAPVAITPAANPFRTPEEDLNLPTEAQTAEGSDSSIGTGGQPVSVPNNAPSVAITPPSPAPAATTEARKPPEPQKPVAKEDQLDP